MPHTDLDTDEEGLRRSSASKSYTGLLREDEHSALLSHSAKDLHGSRPRMPAYYAGTYREYLWNAKHYAKNVKIGIIFIVLLIGIIAFGSSEEPELDNTFALSSASSLVVPLMTPARSFLRLVATSADQHYIPEQVVDLDSDLYVYIRLEQGESTGWISIENHTQLVGITNSTSGELLQSEDEIVWKFPEGSGTYRLNITTNSKLPIPLELEISQHGRAFQYKEVLGGLALVGMYILIIFESIDRTLAAILGSFMVLAVMAFVDLRPDLQEITSWIDYNTLALLFGMMLIVGIFSTTGFFEYIALKSYEISKGRVWRLVLSLCIFTAVASGVLDNVTSMLLLTPVVVRLCKVINISPIPVLMATVTISNIGGCATAVGDPPMVIISNSPFFQSKGIGFFEIFIYMFPGTAIITTVILFFYKYRFRAEFSNPTVITPGPVFQLQKEIDIWKSTEKGLNTNIPEERRVKEMLQNFMSELQTKVDAGGAVDDSFSMVDLGELRKEYRIHNKKLFIACATVLSVVIIMFFLENFASWIHLPLPWIAVLGALLIMVLADLENMDTILHKVEWPTLIFFGALFVLMEGLAKLGLVTIVGDFIANLIANVSEEYRVAVSITVIVWVSSIVSAIIDSIPYTTAMIPIIVQLASNQALRLPIRPLVFSLAFGTGLGGNGTLIGSTANLVMAGLAGQYGYPITFVQFFKTGFAVMLISTFLSNIYLLFVHSVFGIGLQYAY